MGSSREGETMAETIKQGALPENVPLGQSSDGWEEKVRVAGVDEPRRGNVVKGHDGLWYWIPKPSEIDDPLRREALAEEEQAWDVDG